MSLQNKIKLGLLSSYRTQLMGIAALMIIVCHAKASNVIMPSWFGNMLNYGNFGVDVFLFLSGIGCFYSLNKRSEGSALSYYKRRIFRIVPAYLMVFIPYNVFCLLLGEYGLGEALLSLTALEFWPFHRGAWFISLIIPLYLLSPFLYKVLVSKRKWIWTIGLVMLTMLLCSIHSMEPKPCILCNIQAAFGRSPSFVLGMAIAGDVMKNKQISIFYPLCLVILYFPLDRLMPNVIFTWLFVPMILLVLVSFISCFKQYKLIDKIIVFMGRISLESYLLNIKFNSLLSILIIHYGISSPLLYGKYFQYSIVIVFGTLLAFLVHKISSRFVSNLNGYNH